MCMILVLGEPLRRASRSSRRAIRFITLCALCARAGASPAPTGGSATIPLAMPAQSAGGYRRTACLRHSFAALALLSIKHSPQRGEIFIAMHGNNPNSAPTGRDPRDMSRPVGADFVADGIGYKYVAPLGLLDFAALNARCERDSSGTTRQRRVMERIARPREAGARPNFCAIISYWLADKTKQCAPDGSKSERAD